MHTGIFNLTEEVRERYFLNPHKILEAMIIASENKNWERYRRLQESSKQVRRDALQALQFPPDRLTRQAAIDTMLLFNMVHEDWCRNYRDNQ